MNAISAGHQVTLEVAEEILKSGGNAFDAAIAAYLAMFITEPVMASAGGNGFALTRTASNELKFFDFFAQTPLVKQKEAKDFYPIDVDFDGVIEQFHVGMASIAVPGTIAGVFAIHQQYGSIPMSVLVQPAQALARDGVVVDDFQGYDLNLLKPILAASEEGRTLFFESEQVKKKGDIIKMAELPDFLNFIAQEGSKGFYKGEIGDQISKDSKEKGGHIRRADFEQYQVNIHRPFEIPFRNYKVFVPTTPSKGAAAMALMLSKLDNQIESIPRAIKWTQNILKGGQWLSELSKNYPDNNYKLSSQNDAFGGTSHFNIVDKAGNAIALTTTIGEGSGYFIKGTNMQLNNMMGEIFLLPNGAHSWLPATRMNSMMTPTIVLDENKNLFYVGGSGGASRIPYSIGQVLYQLLEKKKSLSDSINFPRYHFQDEIYQVEDQAQWNLPQNKVNFWDQKSMYFGGVHSIHRLDDKISALGDQRRYGVAKVF